MIRVSDIVHASVFVACIGCGALVLHFMHRSVMQGIGYGLVAWVALMLIYSVVRWRMQPTTQTQEPSVAPEDDDTAFEIEDGKDD